MDELDHLFAKAILSVCAPDPTPQIHPNITLATLASLLPVLYLPLGTLGQNPICNLLLLHVLLQLPSCIPPSSHNKTLHL
jgi:hypothetical protein